MALGSDVPVHSYFGVQYGRSPEHLFRFKPPEDPWKWSDVRNATDENRPMCMQVPFLPKLSPKVSYRSNVLVLQLMSPFHQGSLCHQYSPLERGWPTYLLSQSASSEQLLYFRKPPFFEESGNYSVCKSEKCVDKWDGLHSTLYGLEWVRYNSNFLNESPSFNLLFIWWA